MIDKNTIDKYNKHLSKKDSEYRAKRKANVGMYLGMAKEFAPKSLGSADELVASKIKNQQKSSDWWNTSPNERKARGYGRGGDVEGTYGGSQTPSTIYYYEDRNGGTWYVADGSVNVNYTYDSVDEGVDIETLSDTDTFTSSTSIESAEQLEDMLMEDGIFAKGGLIQIKSGNKGKSEVVFEGIKGERTNNKFINDEIISNQIFDLERAKGKSVFLIVDDEVWDEHIAKGDEEDFAKGGKILSKEVFEWVEVYKRNNKEHYDNFNEEVEYEEEKIDLNNANDLPEVFFLEIRERLEEDGHSEEEIDNAIEEYFNKYYDEDKMFITKSYAKGGSVNMNKHIWEGWSVGDFIEHLEMSFQYQPKFESRNEVKKWAMSEQPYYKKYIPDVVNHFWDKSQNRHETWGFAKGGKTKKIKRSGKWGKNYSELCSELATYKDGGSLWIETDKEPPVDEGAFVGEAEKRNMSVKELMNKALKYPTKEDFDSDGEYETYADSKKGKKEIKLRKQAQMVKNMGNYEMGGNVVDGISQEFYGMNIAEIDGEGIDDVRKLKAIIFELNNRLEEEKGILPFDSEAQGFDEDGNPYGIDNLPFAKGGIIKNHNENHLMRSAIDTSIRATHPYDETRFAFDEKDREKLREIKGRLDKIKFDYAKGGKLYTKDELLKKFKGKFIDTYPNYDYTTKETKYEVRSVKSKIHENHETPEEIVYGYAKGGEVLYKYKVSAISKGGNRLGDKVAKTKKEAEEMKKEYLKKGGIKKVEITKNILRKPTYAKGGWLKKNKKVIWFDRGSGKKMYGKIIDYQFEQMGDSEKRKVGYIVKDNEGKTYNIEQMDLAKLDMGYAKGGKLSKQVDTLIDMELERQNLLREYPMGEKDDEAEKLRNRVVKGVEKLTPKQKQEFFDEAEGMAFAKGGDTSEYKVESVVNGNNGSWTLEEYQKLSNKDWMGKEPLSLERTIEKVFELNDEAMEYELYKKIKGAEDVDALGEILKDNDLVEGFNTYNQSWWGGTRQYYILKNWDDKLDLDYETIVFLSFHRGGDVRGNYEKFEAFELDAYGYEDFPVYSDRLSYVITKGDKSATFDTEDDEGYSLYTIEDDFGKFEVDDSTDIERVSEEFNVSMY